MHVFGLLLCLLSMPVLAATEITTKIYDIDRGQKKSDETLILLTSGHVARINQSNILLMEELNRKRHKTTWFKIKLDEQRFITDIEETEAPFKEATPKKDSQEMSFQDYLPTTIESMDVAQRYHREARLYDKDSQCFNRAMVWSYEWWKKHSLKSNKLLIYFTRTYIRRYNFEWWFHIAPYVHIMHDGKVVERVMDVKYTRGPLEFTRWSNIFMRNDAPCQVITKYSDYADHPYIGECYFQRTNMYTYQPADLQMNEAWGYTKTNFNIDEVRGAYLEAFDERI